jgi:acyl carrier protein
VDNITSRLTSCFQAVFPDLPASEIPIAAQDTVRAWDSVATITLINVIDDEFHVLLDYERLAEYRSFEDVRSFLAENLRGN